VRLIAVGVWLGGLSLCIRSLAEIIVTYDPTLGICVGRHMSRGLLNAIGVLVVDVVLLLTMLVGLLRYAHESSTGMWKLLYQQCIVWLALAFLAEIPPVVFLSLNWNSAWGEMFTMPAITILSIGAARMYRSLSERGSFTEYMSSDRSKSFRIPSPAAQHRQAIVSGPLHFASPMQSGIPTTCEAPVFLADHIPVELVSGGSVSSATQDDKKDKAYSSRIELAV